MPNSGIWHALLTSMCRSRGRLDSNMKGKNIMNLAIEALQILGSSGCPRCGSIGAYEHFRTHSICHNCNYTPEDEWKPVRKSQEEQSSWFKEQRRFAAHEMDQRVKRYLYL